VSQSRRVQELDIRSLVRSGDVATSATVPNDLPDLLAADSRCPYGRGTRTCDPWIMRAMATPTLVNFRLR
jgi:hypothetical protein